MNQRNKSLLIGAIIIAVITYCLIPSDDPPSVVFDRDGQAWPTDGHIKHTDGAVTFKVKGTDTTVTITAPYRIQTLPKSAQSP